MRHLRRQTLGSAALDVGDDAQVVTLGCADAVMPEHPRHVFEWNPGLEGEGCKVWRSCLGGGYLILAFSSVSFHSRRRQFER